MLCDTRLLVICDLNKRPLKWREMSQLLSLRGLLKVVGEGG